jgi:hypothetical protein
MTSASVSVTRTRQVWAGRRITFINAPERPGRTRRRRNGGNSSGNPHHLQNGVPRTLHVVGRVRGSLQQAQVIQRRGQVITSRRMLRTASRIATARLSVRLRALTASVKMRSLIAPARNDRPASVGARSSWRSRRSRRRSSSLASTNCSRDCCKSRDRRCRSFNRRTPWMATPACSARPASRARSAA